MHRHNIAAAICVVFGGSMAPGLAAPSHRSVTPVTDPGVDVGIVVEPTMLVSTPNPEATSICHLARHEVTVLVSRKATGDWVQVIELSSGKQGWALASRLNIRYTTHPNPRIDLPGASNGTDDDPLIEVMNKSDHHMYLHIGGMAELVVLPHSQQNVKVPAGDCSYNASAPNVIPVFGEKIFLAGDQYTWTFWIGKPGDASSSHPVDTATKREVLGLQQQIKELEADVAVRKQALDTDQAALNVQESTLKTDQQTVEDKRGSIDQNDQGAVDAFNRDVDAANDELQICAAAESKYNQDVRDYNAKLQDLQSLQDRLERLANSADAR